MTMVLALVTTLSMLMLTLGFVFGRIWEIRREMLSKQRRAQDGIDRERQVERKLLKLEAAKRSGWSRRWA
jgi:hypothetical protein